MNVTEWEPVIRDVLDVATFYAFIVIAYISMKLVQTFVGSYTNIRVAKLTGKEKAEESKEPLIRRIIRKLRRKDEYEGLEKSTMQSTQKF